MKYTKLGRTGMSVSRLCLGTMNFGPEADEATSFAIMDKALEVGINFFDTANVYGGKKGEGITEQIVGRWFAQGGGRRERVVLATKAFGGMSDEPNDRGLSARHLRHACEASLRRLKTDHIDLYQMHHVERTTPWEEIWQAMEQLVREGKVVYVGSSNFAGWDIARANETAARRNFMGLVCEQSKYSLATRAIELEVIPACRGYGVGVIAWSPLEGGLLGGGLNKAVSGRRAGKSAQDRTARYKSQLVLWDEFTDSIGEHPAAVALSWILANPAVTGPIIGPRNLEQLTQPLRALEIEFTEAQLQRLNAIWPGPGGEAPAAYAW